MKKSLSLLVSLSTLSLCLPVAFAEDATVAPEPTLYSTTATTTMMQGTCASLKGLDRAACVLKESRAKNKPTMTDKRNSRMSDTSNSCTDQKGVDKVACLKAAKQGGEHMMRKAVMLKKLTGGNAKLEGACGKLHGNDKAECVLSQLHQRSTKGMMAK